MSQRKAVPAPAVNYYFTRAKDTHQESGFSFITLFARLTKESTRYTPADIHKETESVWADIQEVDLEQAIDKIAAMPNGVYTYEITAEVFHGLVQLSAVCPQELYQVTPIHGVRKFKRFD